LDGDSIQHWIAGPASLAHMVHPDSAVSLAPKFHHWHRGLGNAYVRGILGHISVFVAGY
jgi:hypothetical protein